MIESREQWLEKRLGGIGGSDSPVVYNGRVYGRSIMDLYLEKRRIVEPPDLSHVPDIQRGNALEPIAAQRYAEEHGVDVDAPKDKRDQWNRFFVESEELPFMFANVDFFVRGANVIGEIKCPRVRGFMKIQREGLHEHYLIQGQHNLAVTGAERCVFVIFSAEMWKLHVEVVERDEDLIAAIVEANRAFWDCVEEGRPPVEPAPGEPRVATKKSEEMPDAEDGEIAKLDSADFVAAVNQYREAGDLISEVNEIKAEAKTKITEMMADKEVADGGGFRVYNRKTKGRKTFDKKALKATHPEIDLTKFEKTGKPSRMFRIFQTTGEAE